MRISNWIRTCTLLGGWVFVIGLFAPRAVAAVDSLKGTVMCGYQGWFAAEGDGAGVGWHHYGFGKPGECHIDLWPDLSGFPAEERFPTPLRMADGAVAEVFSSAKAATVRRHFDWMKESGIDGIFLQRFGVSIRGGKHTQFTDAVMENVRAASRGTERTWAVMYDLSGLRGGEVAQVVKDDWRRLRRDRKVTEDPFYQKHGGKPVVAVWGVGFNDDRGYSLDETAALLKYLREEEGGACVMAGVPFGWRTGTRDAVEAGPLLEVLEKNVDIVSPWSVGRYGRVDDARRQIAELQAPDAAWCGERGKSYLPVIFPGFSWNNLMRSRGKEVALNGIPRLKGQFFWEQAMARVKAGADMLYVAMFDEVDEGTAIFKCTDRVPGATPAAAGETGGMLQFATYEGLPSDHYLWLTGRIRQVLRGEMPVAEALPERVK
ncbi:MAG: hypothetical protein JWL81_281 [Verrucomicrobiales bacterium]|nr:hypothetical protein [Verrucomicrobiales bacterium]